MKCLATFACLRSGQVRLDVIVLVLAMISFAAALLAYCEEEPLRKALLRRKASCNLEINERSRFELAHLHVINCGASGDMMLHLVVPDGGHLIL